MPAGLPLVEPVRAVASDLVSSIDGDFEVAPILGSVGKSDTAICWFVCLVLVKPEMPAHSNLT